MELVKEPVKTGDILLFNYQDGWFSWAIKYFTKTTYSHSAMIIRDPPFNVPKGLYVWESSYNGKPDPQDDKIKLGVQITPWEEFLNHYYSNGYMYIRRISSNKTITTDRLNKIHDVVYNKPYDIIPKDWWDAYKKENPKDAPFTDRFWCSALVGYIYTQLGFYPKNTDWSMLIPADIANDVIKTQNISLSKLEKITE